MRLPRSTAVAGTALCSLAATGPAGAGEEAPTCGGLDATIVDMSGDPVDGTPGEDVIVATGTVHAKAGNDVVCGTDIWGETGDDALLLTGPGEAHGGIGRDGVRGSAGNDDIGGGPGVDFLRGKAGDDFVRAENGDDAVYGGKDDDYLKGGDGDDYLHGGPGKDSGRGGPGDDELISMTRDR